MEDADRLVSLAEAFTNVRTRRMRRELRDSIGAALDYSRRDRELLDCAESSDLFVVLKPGGRLTRANFDQHEPLLRQAIVAGCAATETFLADRAIEVVRRLVTTGQATARMQKVMLSYSQWCEIESYTRRKRAITDKVLGPQVRGDASTAPSQMGQVLSLVGVDDWTAKIDAHRKCKKGTTKVDLERITDRRNRIAHEGDRTGYSRASVGVDEVKKELGVLRAVVEAIDSLLAP